MIKQRSGNNSSLCFICAPGIGILENWLPVLYELRNLRPDMEFVCIVPKAGTAELISKKCGNYSGVMIFVVNCAGIKGWPIMACEMACSMLPPCFLAVER